MTADTTDYEKTLWEAYDSCAEWCAARGLKGEIGDPLPNLLSSDVLALINGDPESFEWRVRQCAYARAMEQANASQDKWRAAFAERS